MKGIVRFVCTSDSVRSQITEGCRNAEYNDHFKAFSIGREVTWAHLIAITTMKEIGIDVSGHQSKPIEEVFGKGIETSETACNSAQSTGQFFSGAKEVIHMGFPDPYGISRPFKVINSRFRLTRNATIKGVGTVLGNSHA